MGGKHKIANRTKNNARPSSSGRSAELLNSNLPQFGVFSGIKDAANFSSFTHIVNSEDLDLSLDSSFQLVFKKISKKDSTTKSKGLQEFSELIQKAEPDAVKTILPTWARFYNILSTDSDNRVREEAHNVLHQIVLKVKRNIAPFLKQLMAPWFTSQYDTYPPAASAASLAFQDAFPPNKVQDAVVFCQQEILTYMHDNLLVQNAETLSGRNASAEEANAKHLRVVISCLQGYCLYIEKVSPEHIKNVLDINLKILSNNKFWKLSKFDASAVRSAWFKLIATICQKALFLLQGKEGQLLTIVLNNLEEGEPTVLPNVWECFLLTISVIPEWWLYVKVEKLFLPKLMKLLKSAGHGNAAVIYPNLLPVLSYLPSSVLKDPFHFYDTFFGNFAVGLKLKNVLSSKSEASAVATAFTECLWYVVVKNSSSIDLCKLLIKKHLLALVEWCLTDDSSCHKPVFKQVASFIQYLSTNAALQDLVTYFFNNFQEIMTQSLHKNIEDTASIAKVAEKQLEFIHFLKFNRKIARPNKVKFALTDSQNFSFEQHKEMVVDDSKIYLDGLNRVAINLCKEYVKLIQENTVQEIIEQLHSLLAEFNIKDFLEKLSQNTIDGNEVVPLINLYNNVFKNWLYNDRLCCKSVIRLIFLLITYLQDEDKEVILNDLVHIKIPSCLQWSVTEAFGHPYVEDALIIKWLHTKDIGNFFLSIAEKIIDSECSPELNALFKLALTENKNGEILINEVAISDIIKKLSRALKNKVQNLTSLDTCLSLACYLTAVIYTNKLPLKYGDELLLCLFEHSCKHPNENDYVSSDTLWEVNSAWKDTVTSLFNVLNSDEVNELTLKFSSIVECEFSVQIHNESQIEHLASMVTGFLRAAYKSVPLRLSNLMNLFFNKNFASLELVTELCKIGEYVSGTYSTSKSLLTPDYTELKTLQYFVWRYIKLSTLSSSIEDNDENDYSDNEDETPQKFISQVIVLNATDNIAEEFIKGLYDCKLVESFLRNYKNAKYYFELQEWHLLFEVKLQDIWKLLCTQSIKNITKVSEEHCQKLGWFWCQVLYSIYTTYTNDTNLIEIYNQLVTNRKEENDSVAIHIAQTFASDLNCNNLPDSLKQNIVVIRNFINSEEINSMIPYLFIEMKQFQNEKFAQLMQEILVSNGNLEYLISVIKISSNLMKYKSELLSRTYWDFIVVSLVSWTSYCLRMRSEFKNYGYQTLLVAVADLYVNTRNQVLQFQDKGQNDYVDEWKDILEENIHNDIAQIWLYIADCSANQENKMICLPLLQNFGVITECINYQYIFKVNDNFPKWTKFLKKACGLLTDSSPVLQFWGYKMLVALVPGLIKVDSESVNSNKPHKKGLIFNQFKEMLTELQEVVNNMFTDFRLGEDVCTVKLSTDAFTYTLAYLLVWDILLILYKGASSELRYQYADWLKNEDLLKNFLSNLLRLMPAGVLHCTETKLKASLDYFRNNPLDRCCYRNAFHSELIEQFVCYLYKGSLTHLPALVRQWWTDLEPRLTQVVDKITSVYVSPSLCTDELNDVLHHQNLYKNMAIKVMPSIREILAVYTVDEAKMELTITLPANYPLGSPNVECNKQILGTTHKQWLLQFKKCVLHQNGRVADGLSLWNNNLDKKFDGVEECYICFGVLHAGTYQLPRLSCQTCKKKFHSACLYKWFSTSNKSSCPVCRNLF